MRIARTQPGSSISTSYTGQRTTVAGILGAPFPCLREPWKGTIYPNISLDSKCWIFEPQQLASKENTLGGQERSQ